MAESKLAVYAAIAANVAIAVTKFIVAGFTGSSAMLSEGIHSAVDTCNGALLLVGMRLSARPATIEHPLGHGKEMYFWSLIVAVMIFGVGGGVSFYEGIVHLRNPEPMRDPFWNYVVLGAAAVFEGASLLVALRQFNSSKGSRPFWRALHASKDPSTYTVIAEDSAALIGLVIAAFGVWGSHALDMPELDGVASILIGVLLALVAVVLMRESRGLVIGEGIRSETAQRIRELVRARGSVREASMPLSMYIGSNEVLLVMDVQFDPELPVGRLTEEIDSIEQSIRALYPQMRRIYIEARATLPVSLVG
ncbi:MAG: cation diffusion facilitator family transporter [Ideonella sp.]